MSSAPDERAAQTGGDSRVGNFAASVALHNGMNEDRDIPRFGADDYDG